MNNEGTVINNYTIMKPELCEINSIIKINWNNFIRRFEYYEMQCKWELVFDNDISIDVKSKVMYRISVLSHNIEKYLKNKINHYKRQGLEISLISEMNNTFITRLDQMTYKHFIEQRMPMIERSINRKLYKNYEPMKTLDDIDLTLHMGPYESGKRDVYYTSDESE